MVLVIPHSSPHYPHTFSFVSATNRSNKVGVAVDRRYTTEAYRTKYRTIRIISFNLLQLEARFNYDRQYGCRADEESHWSPFLSYLLRVVQEAQISSMLSLVL